MLPEIVFLILGALIGAGASAAVIAMTSRLQAEREERLQIWEQQREREAALRAEGQAILFKRLDSIETLATQVFIWAAQLVYKLDDILSREGWADQNVKDVISPLMENAHLLAIAEALHDPPLEECLSEYSDRIADLVDGLLSITTDPSPETVNRVMELSAGLREPYARILRRLDELKVEGLEGVRYPQIHPANIYQGTDIRERPGQEEG